MAAMRMVMSAARRRLLSCCVQWIYHLACIFLTSTGATADAINIAVNITTLFTKRGSCLGVGLHVPHMGIHTVWIRQQLLMGAYFNHPPCIHHYDLVGMFHCGQAVGYYQHSAVASECQ